MLCLIMTSRPIASLLLCEGRVAGADVILATLLARPNCGRVHGCFIGPRLASSVMDKFLPLLTLR